MTALRRLEALSRAFAEAPERSGVSPDAVRVAEALLFAAAQPMSQEELAARLPAGTDVARLLDELSRIYAQRGVNLVRVAGRWAFRTAADLSFLLAREVTTPQKLSRAAMEVLAIIAYHQPTTRAEIEEIRGVSTSKGTLDTLIETGWIRLRGRRKAPGRPITFGTTPAFLAHFGLDLLSDLPGLDELKGLGFLQGRVPADLAIPIPSDAMDLRDDEEPLEPDLLSGSGEGDWPA